MWVGRYVLMPDHLHLFVGFSRPGPDISAWMRALKGALSATLRSDRVLAPHWQKGFFDHVLRSAESYNEKWHYVHENPVRAGLASRAEDWPYQGEVLPLDIADGKL